MATKRTTTLDRVFAGLFLNSGDMILLLGRSLAESRHALKKFSQVVRQMLLIGYNSLPLTAMVGLFTGMIVALQTGLELKKFGLQEIVGGVVGLSLTREMGPVITAFIIAGRVGAAMAAELGTMKVSEEIDALRAMGIAPERYLVMPRVVATLIMQPILTVYSVVLGVYGGVLVSATYLGVSSDIYWHRLKAAVGTEDFTAGLLKALVFGAITVIVCCQQGLSTEGGASGVGKSTTRAVVITLTMILISDYLLTRFVV